MSIYQQFYNELCVSDEMMRDEVQTRFSKTMDAFDYEGVARVPQSDGPNPVCPIAYPNECSILSFS